MHGQPRRLVCILEGRSADWSACGQKAVVGCVVTEVVQVASVE
jgi:hypothetical protein